MFAASIFLFPSIQAPANTYRRSYKIPPLCHCKPQGVPHGLSYYMTSAECLFPNYSPAKHHHALQVPLPLLLSATVPTDHNSGQCCPMSVEYEFSLAIHMLALKHPKLQEQDSLFYFRPYTERQLEKTSVLESFSGMDLYQVHATTQLN